MTLMYFKTRYQAEKHAKTMVGYSIRIIANYPHFIIECNGNRYLYKDGFVK